jgi:hypothetical protein
VVSQLLVAHPLDTLGHQFPHLSPKNEEVSPPDGTPPTNHDVGSVMASCTLRTHLKGLLSINLVVLVVMLLLDGENFLVLEEDIFKSVLCMSVEETFCSCPSDFLHSRSKVVSL